MGRRSISPRARAAEKRAIALQSMHRNVAAAEAHRDRARAGIVRLEAQLAEREALGMSDESALSHLARLRISLTAAEADITVARLTLDREMAA